MRPTGTTSAFPEFGTDYNKGPADWDTPHNWVVNAIWDVPWGQNRRDIAGALFGGWQLSGIVNLRSGQPLTVFVQNNRSRSQWSPSLAPGIGLDRPDLAAGRTAESAVAGRPDQWFDPTAFQLQPAGTLGNSGRGAFRGPDLRTVDLAAVKSVAGGAGAAGTGRAAPRSVQRLQPRQLRQPDAHRVHRRRRQRAAAGLLRTHPDDGDLVAADAARPPRQVLTGRLSTCSATRASKGPRYIAPGSTQA